jgi:hypothetical protein
LNINFQSAQNKVNLAIDVLGSDFQWLRKVTSGSNAYDTGSSITYGYGDFTVYWVTGSGKAIVSHISANEVIIEPGYYIEDYERLQLKSDSLVSAFDRIIFPSGSGIIYSVLPLHEIYEGNILISKIAQMRRLTPRSGSVY